MSEQNKALENTGSVLNDALSATVEASRSVMMNELPQMVPVLVQAEEQFSINDSWLTHLSESQINYREKEKLMLIDSYFHKIIAFAISLVLHLVVVVVLAWNSNWEKSGIAQDSSSGGIEISLSSLAVEPAALKKKQALVEKTPVQEDLHRAGILQNNPEQQSTTELSETKKDYLKSKAVKAVVFHSLKKTTSAPCGILWSGTRNIPIRQGVYAKKEPQPLILNWTGMAMYLSPVCKKVPDSNYWTRKCWR